MSGSGVRDAHKRNGLDSTLARSAQAFFQHYPAGGLYATLSCLQELEDAELSAEADSEAELDSVVAGVVSLEDEDDIAVASVPVLAASCFAQAVSISAAATSAPRASLIFIDRYPEEKQEW
jgi:hypothetical protein